MQKPNQNPYLISSTTATLGTMAGGTLCVVLRRIGFPDADMLASVIIENIGIDNVSSLLCVHIDDLPLKRFQKEFLKDAKYTLEAGLNAGKSIENVIQEMEHVILENREIILAKIKAEESLHEPTGLLKFLEDDGFSTETAVYIKSGLEIDSVKRLRSLQQCDIDTDLPNLTEKEQLHLLGLIKWVIQSFPDS